MLKQNLHPGDFTPYSIMLKSLEILQELSIVTKTWQESSISLHSL